MSNRFKIKGVEKGWLDGAFCFEGFYLEGVFGAVDPFIGGEFDGAIKDCESHSEKLAWAYSQIGKYLVCGEIMERAFATGGATSIADTIEDEQELRV